MSRWGTQSHPADAGLKHLRGLTSVRDLGLLKTQVTDAGAQQLQQSLPNTTICTDQTR